MYCPIPAPVAGIFPPGDTSSAFFYPGANVNIPVAVDVPDANAFFRAGAGDLSARPASRAWIGRDLKAIDTISTGEYDFRLAARHDLGQCIPLPITVRCFGNSAYLGGIPGTTLCIFAFEPIDIGKVYRDDVPKDIAVHINDEHGVYVIGQNDARPFPHQVSAWVSIEIRPRDNIPVAVAVQVAHGQAKCPVRSVIVNLNISPLVQRQRRGRIGQVFPEIDSFGRAPICAENIEVAVVADIHDAHVVRPGCRDDLLSPFQANTVFIDINFHLIRVAPLMHLRCDYVGIPVIIHVGDA